MQAATDLIESANLITFACMGSSSIAAEEGVMRFIRAGKRCALYRDQSLQAMLATIVGPRRPRDRTQRLRTLRNRSSR